MTLLRLADDLADARDFEVHRVFVFFRPFIAGHKDTVIAFDLVFEEVPIVGVRPVLIDTEVTISEADHIA